jgi:hypothetical protein
MSSFGFGVRSSFGVWGEGLVLLIRNYLRVQDSGLRV